METEVQFDIVVATDEKRGIGYHNSIPWMCQIDMKHFRNLTINNIVVMGNNTYMSIPEKNRPLMNRMNIVITRNPSRISLFNNLVYISSFEDALILCKKQYPNKKIYVIGGESIYNIALKDKHLNQIYHTIISGKYTCDKKFNCTKKRIKNIISTRTERAKVSDSNMVTNAMERDIIFQVYDLRNVVQHCSVKHTEL